MYAYSKVIGTRTPPIIGHLHTEKKAMQITGYTMEMKAEPGESEN